MNVLSLTALKLIRDYLLHKKQGTKNSTSYSDWLEIVFGAHQGSLLGSLLFNIFLEHLFFIMKEIASYADDNTPYISAENIDKLNSSLEESSSGLLTIISKLMTINVIF